MKKLIMLVAVAMSSGSMISTAFADNGVNGQGFENSGNPNACLNAGAGNGGEVVGRGDCGTRGDEGGPLTELPELDPGNSPKHNNAPSVPPGQEPS